MKKLFTTLLLAIATLTTFAAEPPEGSFTWGMQVPLTIDYLATETLSVTSSTISQYTVTYQLLDTAMAHYIAINGNVVTVLNHYAGDSELTQGRIYIRALISGMTGYDDTELITYIKTRKIVPTLQWNCKLNDMLCGSSVALSAIHGNTDRPDMEVTYYASDYVSSPSNYVSIDQDRDILTAVNIGTGVYVTAMIDSTDNYKATSITYLRDDSIVRFNVYKGNRIISWDSTDFSKVDNLTGDLPLRVTYRDPEDTVTIVSDDPLVAEVMPGNILHIYKAGTVRLTASVPGNNNYYDAVSDTTVNIPAAQPVVTWDEDVIRNMDQQKIVTSTTCGFSAKVWVRSNYGDTARYIFSIPAGEQQIAKVVDDTTLCCYAEGTIHLSVMAQAAGRTSQTISHAINIHTGSLEFVKKGNWSDVSCWSRSDLAQNTARYNVNLVNHCTVRNGEEVRCQGLKIYANGSLTIEPQAAVTVEGNVENFGSETGLNLKADSHGTARLFMAGGNPLATVDMYLEHSITGSDTVWSSHGITVDKAELTSNTGRLTVRKWNDNWVKMKGPYYQLDAFTGYLIADAAPGVYTVSGRLMTDDRTFTLRTTQGGTGIERNRNYIANSYTAPVNISGVEFEDMNSELFLPVKGQYRTLPKYTAMTMGYGKWQSSQALFAKAATNESKIKIDYKKAVLTDDYDTYFNMLKISVTGQSGYSDTLVLMDAAFCSEEYDDGYDGTKWAGDTCMPQLYATTTWGKAYVNVEQSIVAQRIGFKAARQGEFYTIRFHTEGLDSTYKSLYLFDSRNQEFTDIIAGEEYTFTGSTLGESDRFTIMRDKVVPKKDEHGRCIMVLGDKVLLVGFENSDVPVRVMTFDGKTVCQYNTKDGPWLQLPHLVTGFYFINAERCTTKFYR